MPLGGYADVLEELTLGVRAGGTLVPQSATEVLERTSAAAGRVARGIEHGIDEIPVARRADASEAARLLARAAGSSGRGAAAIEAAPRLLVRRLETRGMPHGAMLESTAADIRRGVALIDGITEIGTPSLRSSTMDARESAAVIATRRSAVREQLAGSLDDDARRVIADGPPHGVVRRAFASRPLQAMLGQDVLGADRAASAGSNVIVAPVHAGLWDIGRINVGHDLPMRTLAVDWLWDLPLVGPMLDDLHAYPVSLGDSRRAVDITRGVLADGQDLLMYPSGTIPLTRAPMPARTGIARIAIETGTPIVPVGESMTAPARAYGMRPASKALQGAHRSAMAWGDPIPTAHLDPTSEHDVIALAAEVESRQRELSTQARAHLAAARRSG